MNSASLEFLKWIAVILMTGDHIDAALFGRTFGVLTELGRLAMPIFAAVFAFNLARPETSEQKIVRLRNKLLMVGAIAYPFHVVALGQGPLALNILFAFAVAAQCVIFLRRGRGGWLPALCLFAFAGLFLEFLWAAPLVVLAWWNFYRDPSRTRAWVLLGATFALLNLVNLNVWAVFAIPLVLVAMMSCVPKLPRARDFFWVYYPAHLALLASLAWVIR